MNKKVPLLIMHFLRTNTIYSYQVLWWLNAVCCPLVVERGNEMKSERRAGKGKTALPEEEKPYGRLSFPVLLTLRRDLSVKRPTSPPWVDHTVAQVCWTCNIYSTISVCALDYGLYFRWGASQRETVWSICLIIMKREWGVEIELLQGSL